MLPKRSLLICSGSVKTWVGGWGEFNFSSFSLGLLWNRQSYVAFWSWTLRSLFLSEMAAFTDARFPSSLPWTSVAERFQMQIDQFCGVAWFFVKQSWKIYSEEQRLWSFCPKRPGEQCVSAFRVQTCVYCSPSFLYRKRRNAHLPVVFVNVGWFFHHLAENESQNWLPKFKQGVGWVFRRTGLQERMIFSSFDNITNGSLVDRMRG